MHNANVQDRDGAKWLIEGAAEYFPMLKVFVADGGYAGKLVAWTLEAEGLELLIVKRTAPELRCFPSGGSWSGHFCVAHAAPEFVPGL